MLKKTKLCARPDPEPYATVCPDEIIAFAGKRQLVISRKPEGAPVCLEYTGGILRQVTALESGGLEGNGAARTFRQVCHVPETIHFDGDVEVYGTVTLSWKEYKRLWNGQENIPPPDRLAKELIDGTVQIKDARPELIAWHCGRSPGLYSKQDKYRQMKEWGFKIVDHRIGLPSLGIRHIRNIQNMFNPYTCEYPTGALLFEYDVQQDIGQPLQRIALKWEYDIFVADLLRLV